MCVFSPHFAGCASQCETLSGCFVRFAFIVRVKRLITCMDTPFYVQSNDTKACNSFLLVRWRHTQTLFFSLHLIAARIKYDAFFVLPIYRLFTGYAISSAQLGRVDIFTELKSISMQLLHLTWQHSFTAVACTLTNTEHKFKAAIQLRWKPRNWDILINFWCAILPRMCDVCVCVESLLSHF